MTSHDVANYLYEVGSNQRKLEYCRQIMASNTNFIPNYLYNIKLPNNTNTQTKSQFIQNLRNLSLGCNPQEEELIFAYFQIDNKNYITFDDFQQMIVPQTDQSYKKLITKRKGQQFVLDYALKYALQKYFFQIIENQVKLELLCKFTFPKAKKEQKKIRSKKIENDGLIYFLNAHSKYPDKKMCDLIVRQMNFTKGQNRRNQIIVEYILEFNQKYKNKQTPPVVVHKDVIYVPPPSRKKQETKKTQNKQNKILNNQQSIYDNEDSKPIGTNTYPDLSNSLLLPGSLARVGRSYSAINEVQNRIKQLMDEVNIKNTSLQTNKFVPPSNSLKNEKQVQKIEKQHKQQKQQKPKQEIQQVPELKNSILQQIKKQLKRQKQSKIQPRADSNFKNITIKSKRQTNEIDHESTRNDFEYEALTARNKTERYFESKIKKQESIELDNQSFGSSQVVFKPKTKLNNPPTPLNLIQKQKQQTKNSKYDYLNTDRGRYVEQGKKRLQYLKSLIEQKDTSVIKE